MKEMYQNITAARELGVPEYVIRNRIKRKGINKEIFNELTRGVYTPKRPNKFFIDRIGEITRYFTQRANNPNSELFEITKKDSENENSLYKYTSFTWKISGKRDEVIRENKRTIDGLSVCYTNINQAVFPLQLWKPPKDSSDDLQKKLSLLKKT